MLNYLAIAWLGIGFVSSLIYCYGTGRIWWWSVTLLTALGPVGIGILPSVFAKPTLEQLTHTAMLRRTERENLERLQRVTGRK